ncbi:hypothetical protein ACFX11_031117 [Malus domestica]
MAAHDLAIIALLSPKLDHHFLVILLLLLIPCAAPLSFEFPTFRRSDHTNSTEELKKLVTEGDAVIGNQSICLTEGSLGVETNKANGSVGRATYSEPFLLRDNNTGKLADFSTSFTFMIDTKNSTTPSYVEGLAFFLAPNGSLLNRALGVGSSMGLAVNSSVENGTQPRNEYPFVAVEFHMHRPTVEDPDGGRVGIDINSVKSNITRPWNSGILEGKLSRAWIRYNSSSKNLSVSFTTYANDTHEQVVGSLIYMVDLNKYLPDWVIVGFSASTGASSALHITSWNFTSTLIDDESLALSGEQKKQESPVPTPGRSSKAKSRKRKKSLAVIIGSTTGGGGFILICVVGLGVFNSCKKRIVRERTDTKLMSSHDSVDQLQKVIGGPRQFSYSELASATGHFSEREKLGDGNFGVVYKGYLKDLDSYAAVEKISLGPETGIKEVVSEVRIISRLRHRNLMQLIGWCHKERQLLLAFEFMPKGRLDAHLFEEESSLVWEVRYKIAQGLASGLLYLQQELEHFVLHTDVKSRNVMLDSNFNPKLGGFGLAKLLDHEEGIDNLIAGTYGYMAPEFFTDGKYSKKTDVYSFGVVALEIACGRKPIDHQAERSKIDMVEWVWELYEEGKVTEAADPKLCGIFDEQQMECLMIVGLWCAHPCDSSRPSIQEAIRVLNFELPLPDLPPKKPIFPSSPSLSPPPSMSLSRLTSTNASESRLYTIFLAVSFVLRLRTAMMNRKKRGDEARENAGWIRESGF